MQAVAIPDVPVYCNCKFKFSPVSNRAGAASLFSALPGPSLKPDEVIMMSRSQGFAASYVGEYLKDTGTAEKFNVGEYWVDLRCVTKHENTQVLSGHCRGSA